MANRWDCISCNNGQDFSVEYLFCPKCGAKKPLKYQTLAQVSRTVLDSLSEIEEVLDEEDLIVRGTKAEPLFKYLKEALNELLQAAEPVSD